MVRFLSLLFVAMLSFGSFAQAAEVDQLGKYGFKLAIVGDRWEINSNVNAYYADEFGGTWQTLVNDKYNVAHTLLIVAKPGALGMATIKEWNDDVLNGDRPGLLRVFTEEKGFDEKKGPKWSESSATIGSGQKITVLSTSTVEVNGNKRQIREAYLATEKHWYVLFVFNSGKHEELDDEWATILNGLTIADPTTVAATGN